MTTPAVRVEVRPDAVAVLTVDQPDSRVNVLTRQLWADLEAAVDSLAGRTDVRGLVIASGKPGVFIAGADLNLLANAPGPNDADVRAVIEHGHRVLGKLEALPFATCAAIDGAALGGGLEVALACDYRLAGTDPKVQLGLPEVKLGLIPGWGGTQRLPRVAGPEAAAQMLMTGNPVDAAQAAAIGLVDGVVESARLVDEAARLILAGSGKPDRRRAKQSGLSLSEYPTVRMPKPTSATAMREAFRVMTAGATRPLAEGIKLETEAFLRLAGSDESKQLIAEFFASRKK